MASSSLHITSLRSERRNGTERVSAKVGSHRLWFESDGFELSDRPEVFLTAFFIPALHTGTPLFIDEAVRPAWIEQTKRLLPIYNRWWNYSPHHPLHQSNPRSQPGDGRPERPDSSFAHRTAQCFTGGIDSFYSLLCGTHDASHLLYVHGFDIPIDDHERLSAFKPSLHAAADATGATPITVRTNMREHPFFDCVSWERTHGAGLAAAGMVLANHIDALVIPSSYAYEDATPWGSHWDTDPLWTAPDHLRIIHDDATLNRRDKILELAREPLVQRHLRVCWRNLSATGNCSRCEKCLRTMATLEVGGHLPDYHRVFDVDTPLSEHLDALPSLPRHLTFIWRDLATREVSPATRAAIRRLLRRSNRALVKKIVRRGPSYVVSKLRDVWQSIRRGLFGAPDKS